MRGKILLRILWSQRVWVTETWVSQIRATQTATGHSHISSRVTPLREESHAKVRPIDSPGWIRLWMLVNAGPTKSGAPVRETEFPTATQRRWETRVVKRLSWENNPRERPAGSLSESPLPQFRTASPAASANSPSAPLIPRSSVCGQKLSTCCSAEFPCIKSDPKRSPRLRQSTRTDNANKV